MKLPEEEARYHMKRCVDSGLWVPDANAKQDGLVDPEETAAEQKPNNDNLDLD